MKIKTYKEALSRKIDRKMMSRCISSKGQYIIFSKIDNRPYIVDYICDAHQFSVDGVLMSSQECYNWLQNNTWRNLDDISILKLIRTYLVLCFGGEC